MTRPRNLVVAQSGGPTPVINSSLQGIIEAARDMAAIGTVYGASHGIEGVLKEELLDLSAQPREEVALLRFTPAAGSIGTCRYKLKKGQDEDFQRVIERLPAHDVGYFMYIGGNDSMDTANKVAQLAHAARPGPRGRRRAQDDRQRRRRQPVPLDRSHAGLRLGGPLLVAHGAERQRRERRFFAGRSGAGAAGHGAEDRLHSGRRPTGRSGPRDAAADLPGGKPLFARATGGPGQRSVAALAAAAWWS